MKPSRRLVAALSLGAVLTAGTAGVIASSTLAGAQSSTTTTANATTTDANATDASTAPADRPQRDHGAETALTGDDLAQATAAAETAVPGATVDRAETDADGGVYEVHVTAADGTRSTVHLDASFAVTSVEAGGMNGMGGPRGDHDGDRGPRSVDGVTEMPLTGDDLTSATAAATTAAPGATIDRAETDADGNAFEVHVTQPDGTRATVKLDADFSVVTVETQPARTGTADQGAQPGGMRGADGQRGQAPGRPAPAAAATNTSA